ncbi:hypothetical protein BCV69DRAFT_280459 [Microstroma glucosiphilum]|uniref:holo-[acyl-carrier-protein] synthase n=1 Tax=Pseudomicrostroma glucosiphilum TaxID=1684307 RepID=A0A316UCE2_9BASI|nr:hypothetical protein BCV69DRAFT_280459 [Pseudomicrostroma glucosiphilum]PWN22849.1 hypothetical protein BCV69DRAFT_280459 [Pseudomicrostroma glucosiphilum]
MTPPTSSLLSPEELAAHVDTCHQVFQIWSGDGELIITKEDEQAVQQLVQYLSLPVKTLGSPESVRVRDSLPAAISFTLPISPFAGEISSPSAGAESRTLRLDVRLPLRKGATPADSHMTLSLQDPPWLASPGLEKLKEAAGLDLSTEKHDGAARIMDTVEALSEAALESQPDGKSAPGLSSARLGEYDLVDPSPTTSASSAQVWAVDISSWPQSRSTTAALQPLVDRLFAHEADEIGLKDQKQSVAKVMRYMREVDRTRALAALLLPRVMLLERAKQRGDVLGWDELSFGKTKEGRPHLAFPPDIACLLDYNVTHDSDWVAMASRFSSSPAEKVRVGIDVMSINLPHYEESATTFLETMGETTTKTESKWVQEAIQAGEEDEGLRRLYDLWTHKEALTKNIGLGMGFDFARVEIGLWDCEGVREERQSKSGAVLKLDGQTTNGYTFKEIVLPAGAGPGSEQNGAPSQLVVCEGPWHVGHREPLASGEQGDQSNKTDLQRLARGVTPAVGPEDTSLQIAPARSHAEAQAEGILRLWKMEDLVAAGEKLIEDNN